MTTIQSEYRTVHLPATDIFEAIDSRHSVRQYESRPVPPEILYELLTRALRAPSWKNSQPWKFYAVTGASRERMSAALLAAATAGAPTPDTAWTETYPAAAKRRMFDLGMQI